MPVLSDMNEIHTARLRFTPQFLRAFDKQIQDNTPGIGTALIAIVMPPIGGILWGYYSYRQQILYNNLIKISCDNFRVQCVDQPRCITALERKLLNFDDLANCPIQSLGVLLGQHFLYILQQDADGVERQKERIQNDLNDLQSRLQEDQRATYTNPYTSQALQNSIRVKTDELNNLKTIMEKLRDRHYDLEFTRSILSEYINVVPAPDAYLWRPRIPNTVIDRRLLRETSLRLLRETRERQNSTFLMSIMAHPVTAALSAIVFTASLLYLGLISGGVIPFVAEAVISVSLVLVTSAGLFAGSFFAASARNRHEVSVAIEDFVEELALEMAPLPRDRPAAVVQPESQTATAPDRFCCSIMQEVMTDPVYDPNHPNNKFERANILRSLESRQVNPFTNTPLYPYQLVSDTDLKREIDEWRRNEVTSGPSV